MKELSKGICVNDEIIEKLFQHGEVAFTAMFKVVERSTYREEDQEFLDGLEDNDLFEDFKFDGRGKTEKEIEDYLIKIRNEFMRNLSGMYSSVVNADQDVVSEEDCLGFVEEYVDPDGYYVVRQPWIDDFLRENKGLISESQA